MFRRKAVDNDIYYEELHANLIMGSNSRCHHKKLQVLAAAGVALACYVSLSLYYSGSETWNFRDDLRLHRLFVAYNAGSTITREVTTPAALSSTLWYDDAEESSHWVLNTIGCQIPNMRINFTANISAYQPTVCGKPIAVLKKYNDTHAQFQQDKYHSCAYKFVKRSSKPGRENTKIEYTRAYSFGKKTIFEIESDFIKLKCKRNKEVKEDVFALVRKRGRTQQTDKRMWNVLMIGMDTMSRGRMLDTMHNTVSYFHSNNWIDFKGYHKIADNTAPNLIAALTGNTRTAFYKICFNHTLDGCNRHLMWSKFKEAGYVTAYAEDDLKLPDTFANLGFTQQPTDHYMRPFFLTGEHDRNMRPSNFTAVCAGSKTSGERILDYVVDFALTYKNDPHFGFFWINSNSHNQANMPEAIDNTLTETFRSLERNNALDTTFVIFLSDHGIRFGTKRLSIQSYYEERLPSLFVWVPIPFREQFHDQFQNFLTNRYRLVTPYDLFLTLGEILQISCRSKFTQISEACPNCQSLFRKIPSERKCNDGAVEEKWCSCHDIQRMEENDPDGSASVKAVMSTLHQQSLKVKTQKCTRCADYKLHSVTRIHYYYNKDKSVKYMVVAFIVSPDHVGYEATVAYDGTKYETVGILSLISPHFGKSNCVVNKYLANYCVCEHIKRCKV